MSPGDLKYMIEFRLTVAGYQGSLFQPAEAAEAYRLLYAYTKGLPRDATKICFELLIDLAATGKK